MLRNSQHKLVSINASTFHLSDSCRCPQTCRSMCGDEAENTYILHMTSFKNQIRLNILCVASTTSFSHVFWGGGGRAGKKMQAWPCVTLKSWFCCHSLPFRSIHVGGICVTSRRLGCLVHQHRQFSLFATFHVANSGHQTLKYIGESDCCLA